MTAFKSKFGTRMSEMIEYRVALGYAKKTHERRLHQLDSFIAEKYPNECELSRQLLVDWLAPTAGERVNARKSRASIARLFAEYLISVGDKAYLLPKNYIRGKVHFNPYIFTDAELMGLFAQIDKIENPKYDILKRCTASVLFRLIYTCGLRPGEGYRLKKENVNLDTGEILITETKLKKDRIVVMSQEMLALMKKYAMKSMLVGRNRSAYFFANPSSNSYSCDWGLQILKTCFQKANPKIPGDELPRIRTYDLRHRFASATLCRWLDENKNLYNMLPYLRTYMGHSDLSHTAYYIHILPENLLRAKGIDWSTINEAIPEVEEWES